MSRRAPNPKALDRAALEQAARLLLGEEFKRPLADLLGPHHPDGPRDHLDYRAPFRWFAPPFHEDGTPNKQHRPIPAWVWPVLSDQLHQRSLDLHNEGLAAQRLSLAIYGLVSRGS